MKQRLFAMLLILCMLLGLCACQSTEESPPAEDTKRPTDSSPSELKDETHSDETPAPDETPEEPEIKYWVDLVKNGACQYAVVSENEKYDAVAEAFANDLALRLGVKVVYSSGDFSGKTICFGTKPDTVMDSAKGLNYLSEVALYTDVAIYITAYSPEAAEAAGNRFLSRIKPDYLQVDENGKRVVSIPDTLFFVHTPEPAVKNPSLVGADLSKYRFVYPASCSVHERFMIEELLDTVGVQTGLRLRSFKDSSAVTEYEIVLGKTTRKGSQPLYEGLPDHSFAIKNEGKKIYVAYDNYLTMADAVQKLTELYAKDSSDAIDLVEIPDHSALMVPKCEGTDIRIISSNVMATGDPTCQREYEGRYGVNYSDRVKVIGDMILEYLPDFAGLQEMQEGRVNGIVVNMQTEMLKVTGAEYGFVTFDDLWADNNFTPILYRKTVWTIVDKGYDWVSEGAMHQWHWALFSKIEHPEQKCIVINTHYSGRSDSSSGVHSLYVDLKAQYPDVPIFVVGDLNAQYGSTHFNATINGTTLQTAGRLTDNKGTYTEPTTSLGVFRTPIDHILVPTDMATVKGYRFIDHGLMYVTSGHRPIVADISLN